MINIMFKCYFQRIPLATGLLCSRHQKILFKLFNFAASVCKLAASYSLVLARSLRAVFAMSGKEPLVIPTNLHIYQCAV